MIICADEGVESGTVVTLRSLGHEVIWINETKAGSDDVGVLALATDHEAIILTHDKDFGKLVIEQRLHAVGIVLMRLQDLTSNDRAIKMAEVFNAHPDEFKGNFTVVTSKSVRTRRLVA